MLEKDLKNLLIVIKSNIEMVDELATKFDYSENIAKEIVCTYNYVVDSLEEGAIFMPPNLSKLDFTEVVSEIKKTYEVVVYRMGMLALLIKGELKKLEQNDAFGDLDAYEEDSKLRFAKKIEMLNSEIEDLKSETDMLQSLIIDLESEMEQTLSEAREKDCDPKDAFKVAANASLDIKKLALKIEKAKREIDFKNEMINRKENEKAILEFKVYK